MKINKIETLTCHCKEIKIELKLYNGLEELVRCNCSLCKKRGTIMAKIKLNNLKIIKGAEKLRPSRRKHMVRTKQSRTPHPPRKT